MKVSVLFFGGPRAFFKPFSYSQKRTGSNDITYLFGRTFTVTLGRIIGCVLEC